MARITFSSSKDWFRKQAEKEAKKDTLKRADRFGQVIGIAGTLIVIVFFGYHLAKPTGFFTPSFGAFEIALFFGINIIGIVPQVIRLVKGKKAPARPFDIFNSALFLVALIYFLATFPFDFSHLAVPLPASLEFLLSWVSNEIAKALMVLGIIGLLVALLIQTVQYQYLKMVPKVASDESAEKAPTPAPEEPPKEAL